MAILRLDSLYIVAFVDPSGGKQKGAGRSRSAIAVIGMDSLERVYILLSWAAYCGTDALIDKIFKTNQRYRPTIFGIDSTGPQAAFTDTLQRERRRREQDAGMPIHFPLRAVTLRDEKTFAIETTLQPIAAAGRLFRPPEMEVKELKGEWMSFPGGMYRDSLDALACAIRLLPRRPPDEMAAMSREAYRLYLHRIGVPEPDIARKLADREHRG